MLIVHVFHHYYPFVGGMERVVQGLSEAQARLDHEVHVITSTYSVQQEPIYEVLNDVHIQRVKSWRLHYPDLTIPKFIPTELLKRADIVHVHGHNSLFSIKILKEVFRLGVKSSCYFMAVDAFQDHPSLFIRLLGPYYGRRNTKIALKMANLPLVKSMRDLEILEKAYRTKAIYLPDAIPDYYFTAKKGNPDEFREKFGIKQEKIFLFIGRMHIFKGPHILVNAIKYVDENTAVVLIGPDGGYLNKILNLTEKLGVKDKVYVLGFVDEETKMCALDSATALILPSVANYIEVYPGVISEAWAREIPVIASKVGGIPYRIKQYVNGILVDPSDPKMLAEAMLKVADDDKLAREMGRNGRKNVFSWKEVAMRSIELYRQVLEDGRSER